MEFRQAKHFLAVVENGSVVRAAATLHLAQPSLSQSIRVLEREFGTPLFHRVGRGLVPTPVGLALIKPARQILRDMATAQAAVAEISGMHGGHVDVGTNAGIYDNPLPALIGELRRAHPTVTVHIREFDTEAETEAAVRDGRVEIGFGYRSPDGDDEVTADGHLGSGPDRLQVHWLGMDELCIVVPLEAGRDLPDPLPLKMTPNLPAIVITSGANALTSAGALLKRHSVRMPLGVVSAHRSALIPLVAAGVGICWTTVGDYENTLDPNVTMRLLDPPLRLAVTALQRPGPLAPTAQALLDGAHRWFAGQSGRPGGEPPARLVPRPAVRVGLDLDQEREVGRGEGCGGIGESGGVADGHRPGSQ